MHATIAVMDENQRNFSCFQHFQIFEIPNTDECSGFILFAPFFFLSRPLKQFKIEISTENDMAQSRQINLTGWTSVCWTIS